MSKPLMIGFASPKVYCWSCGKLTKLREVESGLAPCSNCGADLLRWYLKKVGLGEKQASQNAQNSTKAPQSEQEAISKGNESLGGNTP